jgi:hypothetical protein
MDLVEALQREHSKENTTRLVDYLRQYPQRTADLMTIFLGANGLQVQRSSWVVGDLGRRQPELLVPYHAAMLAACRRPEHPAVLRNVLRHFAEADTLSEALHGELADIGFTHLADPSAPAAIRVHAMQVLLRLVPTYPDLAGELRATIEAELPRATPAFRSRGRKVLRALERWGR